MIIYLNWIVAGWHCLLVGALAAAAVGAFGLVDVCQLRVRAATLLLPALNDHTWVFLVVGHWRRFTWFQ